MTKRTTDTNEDKRFEFGKNWSRFLSVVDNERIVEAEKSLCEMLATNSLDGKSFLDIGCGSGLFSLAARRLGARVRSLDYDADSVACARELKRRYFPSDDNWTIEEGSVLDGDYIQSLGQFDVVYSWGVLHHTGRMWEAMAQASRPVGAGSTLFISIYNDQGWKSVIWRRVKRFYCSGPAGRALVVAVFVPGLVAYGFVRDVLTGKNPLRRYREYKRKRGMSIYYDWFDWLGGYPFEVATPEAVVDFYSERGFQLLTMKTTRSNGTNEFVFHKEP